MQLSGDAHSMLKKEFERWPAGAFSPDRFTVEERNDVLYPIYSFVHALSNILQRLWPDIQATEGPTGRIDRIPAVFPSYQWSRNSCWLDVTLEILWNIMLRDFQDFADCFARVPTDDDSDRAGIYQLYQHLRERHALHAAGGTSVTVLTEQRDRFREVLADGKIIHDVTSCENATVWLKRILVASEQPDTLRFARAQNYFWASYINFEHCHNADDASSPHFRLSTKLQQDFPLCADEESWDQHQGKLESWLRQRTNVKPPLAVHTAPCWRNTEDQTTDTPDSPTVTTRCPGYVTRLEAYVSLPVSLIIETINGEWDYPEELVLYPKGVDGSPEVIFDLVGRILHAESERGADWSHYICLLAHHHDSSPEAQVALYDDTAHNGEAILIPDSRLSTHLSGPDTSLRSHHRHPPLHKAFQTTAVAYRLRGGRKSQEELYHYQLDSLLRHYKIKLSTTSLDELPQARIHLDKPSTYVLPEVERLWYSPQSDVRQQRTDYGTRTHPQSTMLNPVSEFPVKRHDSASLREVTMDISSNGQRGGVCKRPEHECSEESSTAGESGSRKRTRTDGGGPVFENVDT
ncbi:hypothetical protein C8Q76DRAFT_758330 [Earliella scabrosa]|nr:hypothetical protein C8Q76DRAFT_758330 [Earliella scabrosa]